ncbi:MAG: ribosomal-processing cysteine protease Prp [Candidatus Riflebacteria bacterium]|nr:ribosomal-processing cysteine protease Prp [Candidatus Riflebacteria bacterium]
MIQVDFTDDDNIVCLKVTGHSGLADNGSDIVCSAVSALVQTFAGGVESELQASLSGNLDSGNCNIRVQVGENQRQALKTVFNVFKFGFRKIAKSYPKQVKLN